jgi:hypothetical protein
MINVDSSLMIKELTRYLGRQVQVNSLEHDKHGETGVLQYVRDKIEGNSLTPTVGVWFKGEAFTRSMHPQQIRPFLRRLDSLTDEEARQCFRLGYPYWDLGETVTLAKSETHIELVSGPIRLTITNQGAISSERQFDGAIVPARVNIWDVLNYLDSLFVDTYGYIERGIAVTAQQP